MLSVSHVTVSLWGKWPSYHRNVDLITVHGAGEVGLPKTQVSPHLALELLSGTLGETLAVVSGRAVSWEAVAKFHRLDSRSFIFSWSGGWNSRCCCLVGTLLLVRGWLLSSCVLTWPFLSAHAESSLLPLLLIRTWVLLG